MTIRIENNHISLSVRDLVHLNPKSQKTFSSFPLPQRGMLGKQAQTKIQQRRTKSYGIFHREAFVHHDLKIGHFKFTIQGRIDGIFELPSRIEVEEIKSVIINAKDFKNLDINAYPEYTEQVLIYCYLLHKEKGNIDLIPVLTLVNLVNNKVRNFRLTFDLKMIETLVYQRCGQIIENIKRDQKKHQERLKQLSKVSFKLLDKRPQQEEVMSAVEQCLDSAGYMLVSAPTGSGKTAAALHPAIKYAVKNKKRIAYLTSKTTQQAIVRDTLEPLISQGLNLNTCFIRASNKMCANDVFFCHEDYCPYAKNYFEESLKTNLIAELLKDKIVYPEVVFERAKEHTICPLETMLDIAVIADILVGDYNYIFDPRIQLRRVFHMNDLSDWILIIDEAHNLYERSLNSLSPEIKRHTVKELDQFLLNKKLKVYRDLKDALQLIERLLGSLQQEGEIHHENQQYFTLQLDVSTWQTAFGDYEAAFIKYLIFKIRKNMLILDDPLGLFYYQLRSFVQIAEMQGSEFIPFYNAGEQGILKIQCCDPSEHIKNIITKFHSAIGMSATLDPIRYYRDILGFPDQQTRLLEVSSPFSGKNRKVIIIPNISTYYRERSGLYPRYAEIIKNIISIKEGNYIVFCPSFEFLQNVRLFLGHISSEILLQHPQMGEEERDYLISQLRQTGRPKVLLAVMGGIFSEGFDYRGDMCIGVIVFSPALPQITYQRELIRQYYENKWGDGFSYAYTYPGINKVIQSAGRLIRSHQDKGIIVLAGERFAQEEINQLFPAYWFGKSGDVIITEDYKRSIADFWERFK